MCSAQQNPPKDCPRDQPGDNSALHSKTSSCKNPLGSLMVRVTFWAWDCLLLWLALIPRSQKVGVFFFSFCPFPPFLSLYRGSFGQPEANHACAHPWPPPEIPVHTQQGPQGDGCNWSLTVSTRASARWLILQWQFRVTVRCIRRHPLGLLKLCYLWSSLFHKGSPNL